MIARKFGVSVLGEVNSALLLEARIKAFLASCGHAILLIAYSFFHVVVSPKILYQTNGHEGIHGSLDATQQQWG